MRKLRDSLKESLYGMEVGSGRGVWVRELFLFAGLFGCEKEARSMAKCMYCHHCGNCGPGSYSDNALKAGQCPFCRALNDPSAVVCASCGRPLPLPPGSCGVGGTPVALPVDAGK